MSLEDEVIQREAELKENLARWAEKLNLSQFGTTIEFTLTVTTRMEVSPLLYDLLTLEKAESLGYTSGTFIRLKNALQNEGDKLFHEWAGQVYAHAVPQLWNRRVFLKFNNAGAKSADLFEAIMQDAGYAVD